MSPDLEQQLRDSLARRAQTPAPIRTDPWAAFVVQERRHRNSRVARRTIGGVVGIGLLAAITVGVVPLPGVVPGVDFSRPAGQELLQDEPTRGSLAGNAAWIKGLRQTAQLDDREGWRVVDRDKMQVHFAGDVPGGRAALVTMTLQKGLLRDRQTVWFAGPANARPQQLESRSNQDPETVSTLMSGSDTEAGFLIVVGPVGSDVRTSLDTTYGPDGRLHTAWKPGAADGLAIVALPPTPRAPRAVVEVTRNGRTLFSGSPTMGWSSEKDLPAVTSQAVQAALDSTGVSAPADLNTVTEWVRDAMRDAGQKPEATSFRIPWTGRLQGSPAALIELKTVGGGVIYYSSGASAEGSASPDGVVLRHYLRLLVPAQGAETRPILWRERAPGSEAASTTVDVIVPARTDRAELVRAGTTTRITPDAKGLAVLTVPVGEQVSVRAYDADDRLLGETPLPDLEVDTSQFPGIDRSTRLVD